MITFTAIPPESLSVCTFTAHDCWARPTKYVWDDARDHEHRWSPCTPGLCLVCWDGHACCEDESHIADVVAQTLGRKIPA